MLGILMRHKAIIIILGLMLLINGASSRQSQQEVDAVCDPCVKDASTLLWAGGMSGRDFPWSLKETPLAVSHWVSSRDKTEQLLVIDTSMEAPQLQKAVITDCYGEDVDAFPGPAECTDAIEVTLTGKSPSKSPGWFEKDNRTREAWVLRVRIAGGFWERALDPREPVFFYDGRRLSMPVVVIGQSGPLLSLR